MPVPPQVLAAADEAERALLGWHGGPGTDAGTPLGRAVVPYLLGTEILVALPLADAAVAVDVRADRRVALLVGDWHVTADATVRADPGGQWFATHLLDAELEKYPPARRVLRLPGSRLRAGWFLGRAVLTLTPRGAVRRRGDDASALVSVAAHRYPRIDPVDARGLAEDGSAVEFGVDAADGPASLLRVRDAGDPGGVRQLLLAGSVAGGLFRGERAAGSLLEPTRRGGRSERRRAAAGRTLLTTR